MSALGQKRTSWFNPKSDFVRYYSNSGLSVAAKSSDGVIEALERPGHAFAVAVQWHPEDRILISDADRKLFQAFGNGG